jgi:hypothetical protein
LEKRKAYSRWYIIEVARLNRVKTKKDEKSFRKKILDKKKEENIQWAFKERDRRWMKIFTMDFWLW